MALSSEDGGPWEVIGKLLTSVGTYTALAIVIVILLVYKFADNLRELRKTLVTILLFRQIRPIVGGSLDERRDSVEKRIEAVKAIEENSPVSQEDDA